MSLDGDLLVHPDDLMRVLHSDKECVCGAVPCTEDPMLMKTLTQNGQIYGVGFSREEGEYEWTCTGKDRKTYSGRSPCMRYDGSASSAPDGTYQNQGN